MRGFRQLKEGRKEILVETAIYIKGNWVPKAKTTYKTINKIYKRNLVEHHLRMVEIGVFVAE
jgi:anaerobic glycerol-3-phosphate dehydrogenase